MNTLIEPAVIARYLGPATDLPTPLVRPVAGVRAALGFPSPAEDFEEDGIDLNELLIRNPPATFFYRAEGWSMVMAGVLDGDILVVDRSVSPRDGDLVIAVYEGNTPTCKILHLADDHVELHARNPHCPNIVLPPGTEVEVFAVVSVVRQMRRERSRVRTG